MATPFKIGDIVQLKSGGPKMTVTNVTDIGGPSVSAKWFAGAKLEHGQFPPESLIPVADEQFK
jgi:uncharacterized protein YodC (DUF2158 family)